MNEAKIANVLYELLWTAAYSSWEWETGETEQEAITNLKNARKERDKRYQSW